MSKAATDRPVMVSTRVPIALARQIKLYAVERGISLQDLIREALERRVGIASQKAQPIK